MVYPCFGDEECFITFFFLSASYSVLYRHRKQVHLGIRYPCQLCDHVTTQMSNLKKHMEAKHEGFKLKCPDCDYVGSSSTLLRHKKSVHNGIVFTCTLCDYAAAESKSLQRHIENKHHGIKYPCDKCSYEAPSITELKSHVKCVHDGVKYKCDQCDFGSDSQRGLKVHVGRSHKETEILRAGEHEASFALSEVSEVREEDSFVKADTSFAVEEQETAEPAHPHPDWVICPRSLCRGMRERLQNRIKDERPCNLCDAKQQGDCVCECCEDCNYGECCNNCVCCDSRHLDGGHCARHQAEQVQEANQVTPHSL